MYLLREVVSEKVVVFLSWDESRAFELLHINSFDFVISPGAHAVVKTN